MALRNDGILPQHYTSSQPEDRGSMVLRNVGVELYFLAKELDISSDVNEMPCPGFISGHSVGINLFWFP